ncbi:unnamed protein product [Discosporangium mesarthrocarpum]
MGDLAVEHGFYGSEWDADDPMTYEEAGEALTVTDANEVWVFHILSDDTSTSAVWAAQRVPDNHVSVVANQFVIKEVSPDADSDWFMFSENLFQVAERGDCGYEQASGHPLHFTKAFAVRPEDFPYYTYSTRRMWRVFDIFAPSLGLSPYTDALASTYPFSAKPDFPVSTQDVMRVVRDHYEGTAFDLTKGLASGPYGDPDRYDMSPSLDGSTTVEDLHDGFFERSISLFRTSYSSITKSRSSLPDDVGALVWIAQYKPSASTFVPIYVNIEEVPRPYTVGSLFRYTPEASYWSFSVVGNWMVRFHNFAHVDVAAMQSALEDEIFSEQPRVELEATTLVQAGDMYGAASVLTAHVNASAMAAVSAYHKLFNEFVARYHDGYQMLDPGAERIKMNKMFYPKYWLESVGFFHSIQNDEDGKATRATTAVTRGAAVTQADSGKGSSIGDGAATGQGTQTTVSGRVVAPHLASVMSSVACAGLFVAVGVVIGRWSVNVSGYSSLGG